MTPPKLLLPLAVLLLLAPVADADAAVNLVTDRGNVAQPYQRWADRADVHTPNITITIYSRPCPELPEANGCVVDDGGPASIYINPARLWRRNNGPYLLMHEIGHHFDLLYLTAHWRERFEGIFNDVRPWRSTRPPAADINPGPRTIGPPAERFAQAYAECAVKGPEIERRPLHAMKYRYRPTPRQHHRACHLISRVPLTR